ncbi:hypothetical protein [Ureaplasma canigenitalium]|uniref:hypothetical protein n=1 Tax=Ureaplasma canigenitalium TaxID=42092 RepID=UPI0004E16D03|nr:hypothetical protein [Ureaplasma canigenitalium]
MKELTINEKEATIGGFAAAALGIWNIILITSIAVNTAFSVAGGVANIVLSSKKKPINNSSLKVDKIDNVEYQGYESVSVHPSAHFVRYL